MIKRSSTVITIIGSIFLMIGCTRSASSDTYNSSSTEAFPLSRLEIKNIQIGQGKILPPYGIRVTADVATLTLSMSTSKKDTAGKLVDLQDAINHISNLASKSNSVTLQNVSINRVDSSISRGTSTPQVENLDTTSVTLKLTTNLAKHNNSLIESLTVFNDFLKSTSLPQTITVQVLSLDTEIKNPEMYREQLIAKVYQELKAIKEKYGQSVRYEVTGLHGMPKMMMLTDTDYYIYIEPVIILKEF